MLKVIEIAFSFSALVWVSAEWDRAWTIREYLV